MPTEPNTERERERKWMKWQRMQTNVVWFNRKFHLNWNRTSFIVLLYSFRCLLLVPFNGRVLLQKILFRWIVVVVVCVLLVLPSFVEVLFITIDCCLLIFTFLKIAERCNILPEFSNSILQCCSCGKCFCMQFSVSILRSIFFFSFSKSFKRTSW